MISHSLLLQHQLFQLFKSYISQIKVREYTKRSLEHVPDYQDTDFLTLQNQNNLCAFHSSTDFLMCSIKAKFYFYSVLTHKRTWNKAVLSFLWCRWTRLITFIFNMTIGIKFSWGSSFPSSYNPNMNKWFLGSGGFFPGHPETIVPMAVISTPYPSINLVIYADQNF